MNDTRVMLDTRHRPLGKWMFFRELPDRPDQSTHEWVILDRHGGVLGSVKWFGRWRGYAFFAYNSSVFNTDCMKDIVAFIEERMTDWREGKKRRAVAESSG